MTDVATLPRDLDGDPYRVDGDLGPWKVTACCGAYATGTDDGPACRVCYELTDTDGPARVPTCTNPAHDHYEAEGAEVSAHWYGLDGAADGVAILPADSPMRCSDCGRPLHYDNGAERYVHDDPDAACFLHEALADVEDATGCTS